MESQRLTERARHKNEEVSTVTQDHHEGLRLFRNISLHKEFREKEKCESKWTARKQRGKETGGWDNLMHRVKRKSRAFYRDLRERKEKKDPGVSGPINK